MNAAIINIAIAYRNANTYTLSLPIVISIEELKVMLQNVNCTSIFLIPGCLAMQV